MNFHLNNGVVHRGVYNRNRQHLRERGVILPKISDLAGPNERLSTEAALLSGVDPDCADPKNLFRIHWYNDTERKNLTLVPEHIVLSTDLTGVNTNIIVVLGNRFPMIRAHKVLAAYACLIPRLISGNFDLSENRAIWPSTGNYCRGGVAISRILGCRSLAVLPKGMSTERFDWLKKWSTQPSDILRTPGTESNVKEIYDACRELEKDPKNSIFNQFSEYGNYIIHRAVTGPALEKVFNSFNYNNDFIARAYIAASGSAGALAAGDYLKEKLGTNICVVEAIECPTLLYNGYGEHNIQGISDKHLPLIHNVMNTDFVIGVTDKASDNLNLLFNTKVGRDYLAKRTRMSPQHLLSLGNLGLSSIANILGAIKYAKYMELGPKDAVITVATDGAELYGTEKRLTERMIYSGNFDVIAAAEVLGRYILGLGIDHILELDRFTRERIFNLGYFTWVEQQGLSLTDFDSRRNPQFWNRLMDFVPLWDEMIDAFNSN